MAVNYNGKVTEKLGALRKDWSSWVWECISQVEDVKSIVRNKKRYEDQHKSDNFFRTEECWEKNLGLLINSQDTEKKNSQSIRRNLRSLWKNQRYDQKRSQLW